MKRMAFSKVLMVVAGVLMVCSLIPTLGGADTAQYFYDPLGRLSAVVDGQGNVATYQYDAVGNLLSISRGLAAVPTIANISPNTFVPGQPTFVTITGTGLLLASLTVSNSDVIVSGRVQADTTLTATFTVQNPTTPGPAAVTVKTPGGTASVGITISQQPTPAITQLSPTSGIPGTVVTIQGSGFGTRPGSNRVTFAGAGVSRLPATVTVQSFTRLTVQAPAGVTMGPVSVEVASLTSNTMPFTGPPILENIIATAEQGVPQNLGTVSANIGQTVQLTGRGFTNNTLVKFTATNPSGAPISFDVSLLSVSPDGTSATVSVPFLATTGVVSVRSSVLSTVYPGGVLLQIVPTLTSMSTSGQSLAPGVVATLSGSGFKANATTVIFPGAIGPVSATTILGNSAGLTVTAPAGVTAGSLIVRTDGGTSASLTIPSLTALVATAPSGIPTAPGTPSANAIQAIQLQGTGVKVGMEVYFPTTDLTGAPGVITAFVGTAAPNGLSGTVIVPQTATTGTIVIGGVGSAPLQVVPTVTSASLPLGQSLAPGTVVTLSGSGFKANATTVTFSGAAGPVSASTILGSNTGLTVTAPVGVTAGPLTVRTDGGTSAPFAIPGLVGVIATATTGTPANTAIASANVNQVIQLQGIGLTVGTQVTFPTIDHAGVAGSTIVSLISAVPDGTSGTVAVPANATSGNVTIAGAGSVPLQVVPTVTSATLPPGVLFAPNAVMTINGTGFKEGATTVLFSGVATPVPATDVFSSGVSINDRLTVTIPLGATGASFAVITDGGASATRQFGVLQSIAAIAPRGTPQNPGQPSANVGQFITVQGVGFGIGSQAIFTSTSDTGSTGLVAAPLINVNPTGMVANVIVPATATSGSVSVDGQGAVPLQIVPTVFTLTLPAGQTFVPGVVATLGGTGFKEGATTVTFSGASPVAASDVTANNSRLTVTIPSGAGAGTITVTADGNIGVFDTTRPSVKQVLPFNGQQNAPLNTRIAALFDEPVQPATVTTTSLFITGPSGLVAGTVTLSPDGQTAIFTPTQPLESTNGYAVSFATAITDLAGNALNPGATTFSTGTLSDTTAPTVANTSPQNGASAVPTNAVIRIYFSESLLNTTLTPQSVTISAGGTPVPVSMVLEQNNTVLRLQPSAPLQANVSYTVSVSPTVEDLAGNSFGAQFTSAFSTGAGADATVPTVSTRTPADGATNVPSDTTIVVTFSEPIEPATVDATSTFTLTGGGISGTIPGTFSFSPDRLTVTVTPLFPLFAGQTFFLTLSGIEDASGNRLATTTSSFAIQAGAGGGVIPAFATVIPAPNSLFANGQTVTRVTIDNIADSNGFLVPDGTPIAVTAAPAFQQTSAGGTILGGTTSTADPRFKIFTTTNGRVRFDYKSPALVLAPGFSAEGIIQVASVTAIGIPISMIGNSPVTLVTSQTATISFNPTTLLPNGTSQAEISVVVRDPINTLDDFGRPIPAGTVMGVGVLFAQGPLGTINGGTVAPDPRYKLFNAKTGGLIDLLYTAPNLVQGPADQTGETFSAVAVDPAGNLLDTFGFSSLFFRTGGCDEGGECVPGGFTGPLPKILAVSPASGETVGTNATITVKFSQSLNPTTVTASTFIVTRGGTPMAGTFAFSASDKGPNSVVTFIPSTPWVSGTVTDVTVTTGITNTAGNPLLASSFTNFSIDAGPDTTGPAVVRASLGNGLTDVPHSAVINAQFNQPVNALSLNSNNFIVSAGGTPISGRISLSNGEFGVNTIATFIQDQLLASDTLYTINVSTSVTDSSGNALTPGFTSTFRTAAGTPVTDVGQPSVDSFSPPNGQQEVPLNPTVTVRTDKAINPITINSGGFGVGSNQGPVEGTVVVAPDQKNWTFAPTVPLAPTTSHSLNVTNGLRDIAGNRLSGGVGSSFVTGTALANPAGPQITSVTPQNTATNVFLNQPITIRFSEPLAASSVTSQTVIVSRGGAPVSGVLTLLDNNRAIRWVPANSGTLAPSALHTITITTGVTGLANNPLATPVTSTFTTGTATDTTAPAVTSFDPVNGAQNVPRDQQIHVTFDEPIDPAGAQTGLELVHSDSGTPIVGALTLSPDRTILQFVPTFPLFSGQTFDIFLGGITDSVGNQMAFANSTFTTAVAPGTVISNVPDSASVSSSPTNLISDGQQTSVITITSIRRGGVPVPDGTLIGVTTYPAFNGNSFPGTLLSGTPSGADSRFVLYSVVGGAVTLTYQTPSLPSGTNLDSWVQVAGVDAAGAPMNMIGQRRLRLFGTGGGQ